MSIEDILTNAINEQKTLNEKALKSTLDYSKRLNKILGDFKCELSDVKDKIISSSGE